MKKILTFIFFSTLFVTTANAYPNVDMSVGGMPFMLLQQQNFQKTEFNEYKQFRDAFETPAEHRTDSPQQLQEEYKIKNLRQPTKIELGKKRTELPAVEKSNQLIQQDGKIYIKHLD